MTATTLQLGLIGAGIQRTRVHRLHRLLGESQGLDIRYDLLDRAGQPAFDLAATLRRCADAGWRGVNVTHPHKPAAAALAEPLPSVPAGLGSANTLLFERPAWRFANTDHSGFLAAWRAAFGARRPGRALLAGAGGVGRSIAFALVALGAERLWIHDPLPERAAALAAEADAGSGIARTLEAPDLPGAMAEADGLANGTPLGMYLYPGSAFPLAAIGGQSWAFEAVYQPVETAFLAAARAGGLACLSGFELFLHQGIDAFELFTGRRLSRQDALARLRVLTPEE